MLTATTTTTALHSPDTSATSDDLPFNKNPAVDEDGFVKIHPDHTQLKGLITDQRTWRLARFRHRVEKRPIVSGCADPVVRHTKLGDWVATRYPNLNLWSHSNLFDPTVPMPLRSPDFDLTAPESSGLSHVKLTPTEIDRALRIFFGPSHGLKSLILTLEPADPREFKDLVINQHAWLREITVSASYAAWDDPKRWGYFNNLYKVSENGLELKNVGSDIKYSRLGNHGVGSRIFHRWLIWNWQSQNVRELKFEAVGLGRYTWRTLNLPISPQTLYDLRHRFMNFISGYNIPHDKEKIMTARTPSDFSYAVHWSNPSRTFYDYALKNIFHNLCIAPEDVPDLTMPDPKILADRHAHYPGVIFLLSQKDGYRVSWNDVYRREHRNDLLVLTPPDRMRGNQTP